MTVLKPEMVRILVDSREQLPFDLRPMPTESTALPSGDYTLKAAPDYCVIERKTGPDLLACIGRGRPRFERELQRLRAFPRRMILVECRYVDLLNDTRTQINHASIAGTLAAWTGRFAPFMFCENRVDAEDFAQRFLMAGAREIWEQAESFRRGIEHDAG